MSTRKKTSDWSLLPEEILQIISKYVEDCFDVVHARSVCNSWRSTFPFPSSLLRPSYSLPTFDEVTLESKDLCTLEKVPLFLFRPRAPTIAANSSLSSQYFLGGIGRDDHHMDLPSPLQCSVKVQIQGYDPALMNMVDCQILSLGHQYRLISWEPKGYRGVAFLPLNKEGRRGEFVVILNYTNVLLVLTSAEMKWKRLENVPVGSVCSDLGTFRGRFYASFLARSTFIIDPYSLEVTLLMPSPPKPLNYLVASGDDELFLVEVTIPMFEEIDFSRFTCRVSRLDEECSKWVEVRDLGDRLLFIGHFGNVSCSGKELPDGCGLSGNSIVFTSEPTFPYKYGVHTGTGEDCWRTTRENRVMIFNTDPVLALQVENLFLDA
ncbi:PREDICTED: F-box/kelch-repeat protein At1g64840-like [Camelina sativa]|uniref:F-box/kelch-repeat protein At1g64840-like n=1 Tax=Camelina sativa TaxID=90675 RepID=A0ABM1QED8_CAMSA|nr:PREDICTED: F-box/kelch-repeat protein At1g64840-like [Camelina sativa]